MTLMTLNGAVEEVKKRDPGCYINRGLLERAIRDGKIGCISVGRRKIVNVDRVMEYLSTACDAEKPRTTNRKGGA